MRSTPAPPPCPHGQGVDVEHVWRAAWEAGFKAALKSVTTEQLTLFSGVVEDAGGGMVDILVDRDTIEYPPLGLHVTVNAHV